MGSIATHITLNPVWPQRRVLLVCQTSSVGRNTTLRKESAGGLSSCHYYRPKDSLQYIYLFILHNLLLATTLYCSHDVTRAWLTNWNLLLVCRKKIRSCCDELNLLVPFCQPDSDKVTTLKWTTAFLRYINKTYGDTLKEVSLTYLFIYSKVEY